MSWVEKYRKINNRGGDDYSGLESTGLSDSYKLVFAVLKTSFSKKKPKELSH